MTAVSLHRFVNRLLDWLLRHMHTPPATTQLDADSVVAIAADRACNQLASARPARLIEKFVQQRPAMSACIYIRRIYDVLGLDQMATAKPLKSLVTPTRIELVFSP